MAVTVEPSWHRVPGGTAVAAIELLRELVREPADEDRAELDLIGVAAWHRRAAPEAFVPPVPVRHLPLPRPVLYESWLALRTPPVQLVCGRVDVVHSTTIIPPPHGRGRLAGPSPHGRGPSRRRPARLVVTIHDLAFVHDPSHFPARGLSVMRRSLALALRQADVVLCPSQATMADCADHGFAPDRLRLVPLGVAPQALVGPDDVERVRVRHGLRSPYLLFNGTIEPRKNLARLLAAYELVLHDGHDLDLVLAGPSGWGEALNVPPAVASRVRALGFVPDADLRALFAGAAVFCMPSIREGFGLPILQAMAQGAAVVTSRGSSTEEVAGGAGVLVDPLDPVDIAAGIVQALGRRDELGAQGRGRAAAMTGAAAATTMRGVYRELAP